MEKPTPPLDEEWIVDPDKALAECNAHLLALFARGMLSDAELVANYEYAAKCWEEAKLIREFQQQLLWIIPGTVEPE